MFAHNSWQSFTHDHRNYFLHEEFELRYLVLDSGTFSTGEWSYIVITSAPRFEGEKTRDSVERKSEVDKIFELERKLTSVKRNFVLLAKQRGNFLLAIGASSKELIVYGAAGKGSVIAMQLARKGLTLTCLDSDPRKNGLYMEGSGVRVVLPSHKHLPRFDSVILVANYKHQEFVKTFFQGEIVSTQDGAI